MASLTAIQRYVKERVKVTRSGCWEWMGSRTRGGYGQARVAGKAWAAHRLAYTAWRGLIRRGYVIRHKCDNPPCCNPKHLEPGWHEDNTRDIVERGNGKRIFTSVEVRDMLSSFDIGESVLAISQRLHTDTRPVKAHLLEAGRKMRHLGRPKGSRNLIVRITDGAKEKIRKLYATGKFTQQQLATRFGCDQTYVSVLVH